MRGLPDRICACVSPRLGRMKPIWSRSAPLARYTISRGMWGFIIPAAIVAVLLVIQAWFVKGSNLIQIQTIMVSLVAFPLTGYPLTVALEVRPEGLLVRNYLHVTRIPWASIHSLVPEKYIRVVTHDGRKIRVLALPQVTRDWVGDGNPPARKACLEVSHIRMEMLASHAPQPESIPTGIQATWEWPPIPYSMWVGGLLAIEVLGILHLDKLFPF